MMESTVRGTLLACKRLVDGYCPPGYARREPQEEIDLDKVIAKAEEKTREIIKLYLLEQPIDYQI